MLSMSLHRTILESAYSTLTRCIQYSIYEQKRLRCHLHQGIVSNIRRFLQQQQDTQSTFVNTVVYTKLTESTILNILVQGKLAVLGNNHYICSVAWSTHEA